ncbi:Na(+)/H(+) exchanger beta-like isoform X1 [Tachypleus tridentatus]|uniref:Na(+)/H(+) exchanger beta-like isoform X1 n=1 Tax=Tachypleus tridentatus TaxID=6853 RepID=UPI003FD2B372
MTLPSMSTLVFSNGFLLAAVVLVSGMTSNTHPEVDKSEPVINFESHTRHLKRNVIKPHHLRHQHLKSVNLLRRSAVTTESLALFPVPSESVREDGKSLHSYHEATEKMSNKSNDSETGDSEVHGIHVASWKWEYVKTPFIYTTFVIIAGLCKVGYHHADFLSTIIPESCILIILGVAVGTIVYVTGSTSLVPHFTSRAFFLFLLPPIVLESAYSLHDSAFFSNLGTILLYALVGTLLNCFTIGPSLYGLSEAGVMGPVNIGIIECLVFSALISAVDPVAVLAIFQEIGINKVLYFLVFGESLLNDAVTVVLYTLMVGLSSTPYITAEQIALGGASFLCVSLGGLLIGIVMGVITALVTKQTQHVRVVEPLAMLGIAYLSYLLAEMVHFSGIISIIACGLVQAQYAQFNISKKSYITVKYFIKMLSAVCDTIIFLFLGMVLVSDDHIWQTGFVFWATAMCLIARFCSVYFLTFLANYFERLHTIQMTEQFIMAYGGLRGAVAFSLVIMLDTHTIPNKRMFVTTTLFIILFTVFIQGSTVKPLVNLLKIRTQDKSDHSLFEEVHAKVVDSIMAGIEEVTGDHSENYWKLFLHYYDEQYFKKWLQLSTSENNLTRVYTKMVLADHYAHLYGPAAVLEDNQPFLLNQSAGDMDMPLDDGIIHTEKENIGVSDTSSENRSREALKRAKVKLGALRHFQAFSLGKSRFSPNEEQTLQQPSPRVLSRPGTEESEKEDASKVLQRAFQNNPFYKYHQKYNPDLVGDDQQEISSHLHARRLRARRLTLSAMSRGHNSNASSLDDVNYHCSNDPVNIHSSSPQQRPLSAPSLPEDFLYDSATNIFLEQAKRRRSIMSGEPRHRLVRSATTGIPSTTSKDHGPHLRRQHAVSGSRDTMTEDNLEAIFESIKEAELEPTNGSSSNSKSSMGRKVQIVSPATSDKKDETPF